VQHGTSLVIDLSERTSREAKVGNERILQRFYQAIPQLPQGRLLMQVASYFVTIEEARDIFPNGIARRSVLGGMVMEEDLSLRIMTRLLIYYN